MGEGERKYLPGTPFWRDWDGICAEILLAALRKRVDLSLIRFVSVLGAELPPEKREMHRVVHKMKR